MAPPGPIRLDVEAISGICGSISIACWVVVFSPQIVENFRRGSADGLSLQFIIIWLLGDVFNILGAVLQGVLPTMTVLAIYYTLADIVLLGQCFFYRGFTLRDDVTKPSNGTSNGNSNGRESEPNERTSLLNGHSNGHAPANQHHLNATTSRRNSWSEQSHHLSPAVPLIDDAVLARDALATTSPSAARGSSNERGTSSLQAVLFNSLAVLMVCASGVAGWYLSRSRAMGKHKDNSAPPPGDVPEFNFWGQIFGWFCAVLYLGSRVPQILLNYRRKSTEGVSILFFLFACLGNLTYVMSIIAYEPHCRGPRIQAGSGSGSGACPPGEAARLYWQYIVVNGSWLAGSLGTLLLDMAIFVQFFVYNNDDVEADDGEAAVAWRERAPSGASDVDDDSDDDEASIDEDRWDGRPILERTISNSPHS